MKLGLFGINMGACVDPATAVRVARAAEACGFDSVWTGEHVILPEPQVPPSPVPASTPLLHPAVALAHVASQTDTIRLATGIIILPQRNAVVLAKELASLDVISGGRLIFGIGAGYIPEEFAAIGVSFEDRGARTDESIDVIRTLWTAEAPKFDGDHYAFANVDAQPRPVQHPHPPIVVGGMSPPAYRRAVARGNGWYGFALDPDATAKCLAGLREAADRVERPSELGPLEITVTPIVPLDEATVARYAELGVHRLAPIAMGSDADAVERFVETTARVVL